MQGNESLVAHVKTKQVSRTRATESSLITVERSQKLDLLIHLISNLRQSLVICGPYGIGKTTLLDELEVRKQDLWSMLTIQASSDLSLESIQDELFRFLKQKNAEYENQALSSILAVLDERSQKIVVIIDNAGAVAPGLITSLIQYAAVNSCLRIVFSLTLDELHLLNSSDSLINDCHFIEIPPLTEKQCSLFLQQLSGQPGAIVSFNAINDRMIEKLYRETHGIPGRIISELPKLTNYYARGGNKWLSVFVISALVAIGISIFISADPDKKPYADKTDTVLVLQKSEVVEISSPVIYPEIKDAIADAAIVPPVEDKEVDIGSVRSGIKKSENNRYSGEDTEQTSREKGVRLQQGLKEEHSVPSGVLEKKTTEVVEILPPVINSEVKGDINDASSALSIENKDVDIISVQSAIKIAGNNSFPGEGAEKKSSEKGVRLQQGLKEELSVPGGVLGKETVEKIEKNGVETDKEVTVADVQVKKRTVPENVTDSLISKQEPILLEERKIAEVKKSNQWVLAQPEKNYTIQLMVLSGRESVQDFFIRNNNLKENLRFYQLSKQGQKKYVLIYGSFKNFAIATKKMKSLPAKYRKSWIRSFKILQKDIKPGINS